MRRRIIKILLIIVLPVIGSFLFYRKVSFVYEAPNAFRDKMNYLYDSAHKHDMLFLGSSRVLLHIDPRVIDSVCHVDSYNLGVEGLTIAELRMMLDVCIRQGKAPRVLVLNVDPATLEVVGVYYNFDQVFDYALRDSVVYRTMAAVQDRYKYKWKYFFYKLQKCLGINDGFKMEGLTESTEKFHQRVRSLWGDTGVYLGKGFRPSHASYHAPYEPPSRAPWQEEGFELLNDIIHTCKEQGIRLVLVTAPVYKDYYKVIINADSMAEKIEASAKSGNVPYLNMMKDTLSMDKQYFYNTNHLNFGGAELYSMELASRLSRLEGIREQ